MENIFNHRTGSDILKNPAVIAGILAFMFPVSYIIAKGGIIAGVGLTMLPFFIAFLFIIFLKPKNGLIAIFLANFLAIGLTRYIKGAPLGLSIDGLLVLTYISLFFSSFFNKIPWKNAKNDLVLLAFIWFSYTLFELVNPEAVSRVAWFYAMRAISLYMLLIIPLIFIIFNQKKDLETFLKIWAVISILGTLKGIMQKFLGVDPFEQAWLDEGNASTHVLFGKLRVFSFYSDAGQFGAAQGQAGVVFLLLSLNKKLKKNTKFLYISAGVLGLYGMMISGTRGAIAVPIMGFGLYFVLRKNVKILLLGVLMGIGVLIFFKYTTIGQGNYTIARMRTAFNPEDASLQVRLENQRKLKNYMGSRPFGGGIGSAGFWGLRFSPNTFLAQTPTDSWYVMIWAEQGVVGLMLHLFILLYVVLKSAYLIMFKLKDSETKLILSALLCGIWGIMVASYGNGVLGQMPTGLILYTSMAYLFLGRKFDHELQMSQVAKSIEK